MDSVMDKPDSSLDSEKSPWGALGRSLTLGFVSLFGKFVLNIMNFSTVENKEIYIEAVTKRSSEVGLITVSNHISTLDDPALHCAILPASFFFSEHSHGKTRWVTCAEEVCFRNEFLRQFFLTGKTLPVKRGGGVHQPIMKKLAELLRKGDWVHIFPEGKINYTDSLKPLKWGVGKLICDSVKDGIAPLVIPFYHAGMGEVMPKKAQIPGFSKEVFILVGQPINLTHLTCKCNTTNEPEAVWVEITQEIQKALKELESKLPKKNKSQD